MAVNFPTNPTNGQTITVSGITYAYDSTQGVWSDNPQGLTQAIDALTDVDTSTNAPTTGQLIQWNGTNWVPYTHTNGITQVDQWRLTANLTADATPISANLERIDEAGFAKIGAGMSVSNGVFTFPATGLYQVTAVAQCTYTVADPAISVTTRISTDGGSNWDNAALITNGRADSTSGSTFTQGSSVIFVNVTNTSNVKVDFTAVSIASGNALRGNTDNTFTGFTFVRMGDSQ